MHVIRHQAVCPYFDTGFSFHCAEQFQVCKIIGRFKEGSLATISPLRDMVGISRNDKARHPWHDYNRCLLILTTGSICHANRRSAAINSIEAVELWSLSP